MHCSSQKLAPCSLHDSSEQGFDRFPQFVLSAYMDFTVLSTPPSMFPKILGRPHISLRHKGASLLLSQLFGQLCTLCLGLSLHLCQGLSDVPSLPGRPHEHTLQWVGRLFGLLPLLERQCSCAHAKGESQAAIAQRSSTSAHGMACYACAAHHGLVCACREVCHWQSSISSVQADTDCRLKITKYPMSWQAERKCAHLFLCCQNMSFVPAAFLRYPGSCLRCGAAAVLASGLSCLSSARSAGCSSKCACSRFELSSS